MRSFKFVLAAVIVAAVAVHTPVAQAQTVHVVGGGSSAQFLGTMIGMSQLAINHLAGGQCIYHWTKKNALNAHDNRDNLGRILDETGNVGIVWDAACSDTTGNTNISDVWLDGQYDSTLGVRLFSAQQKLGAGSGATVYLTGVSGGTPSDNLVSPNNLWADNKADVALPANLLSIIGNASPGTLNVNLGLTDIRPEDALAATKRALAALNTTTWAGLGYVGPTGQIGAPIYTAQSGSTANFTPIGFALSGAKDPINTAAIVPSYTTYPVGAAPIVFIYNNGGTFKSSLADLSTGVHGDGTKGVATDYKLVHLFDGTTSCDTSNPAFTGGGDGTATPLTLFLREPLSGTMNTTEFTVFRTLGANTDSQEVGVINPTRAPYNPLNLACTGNGSRQRRVGNGQVVSAVNSTVNGMGYMFFSFANATAVQNGHPQANYQYFTLDGVDPLGIPGTVNQQLPFCSGVTCPANVWWTGGISYPNLRNGTYKSWSLYRWLIYDSNSDSLGPKALVTSIQDNIDSTVADFVPFTTSTNSDGLEVYRSHFAQQGVVCGYTAATDAGKECNGDQTATESLTDGNSLGGGPEKGGDEGGVVVGWDHSTVTVTKITTGLCAGKSKVAKTAGRTFGFSGANAAHTGGNPVALEGSIVTVNGNSATVSSCIAPTAGVLYVSPQLTPGTGQSFSVYISPTANFSGTPIIDGVLGKKQ
jgi:hypothetical protein